MNSTVSFDQADRFWHSIGHLVVVFQEDFQEDFHDGDDFWDDFENDFWGDF